MITITVTYDQAAMIVMLLSSLFIIGCMWAFPGYFGFVQRRQFAYALARANLVVLVAGILMFAFGLGCAHNKVEAMRAEKRVTTIDAMWSWYSTQTVDSTPTAPPTLDVPTSTNE